MKRLFAFALAAVMLLSTGCDNKQPDEIKNDTPQVTNSQGEVESPDTPDVLPEDEDDIRLDGQGNATIDAPTYDSSNNDDSDGSSTSDKTAQGQYLSYINELDKDGNTVYLTVNTYDENGNIIKQIATDCKSVERTETYYNEYGLVTKQMYYYGDRLNFYYEYTYNENGNITSYRTFNSDGTVNYGKNYDLNYDVKYDSQGRAVERTDYYAEDDYTVTTTEYNDFGLITREKCVSSSGMLISLREHEYDDKNRMTAWKEKNTQNPDYDYYTVITYVDNPDGSYTATTTYAGSEMVLEFEARDKNGNVIEYHSYLENRLYNKHFYTYDENGNITYYKAINTDDEIVYELTIKYAADGSISNSLSHEYTYNDDGTLSKTTTETIVEVVENTENDDFAYSKHLTEKVNGEIIYEETTVYDNNENVVVVKVTTIVNGTVSEQIYEYDSNGNVIKMARYVDGEIVGTLLYEYTDI